MAASEAWSRERTEGRSSAVEMDQTSHPADCSPRLAVDSSRMRIEELLSLRRPRAKARSCRWPELKFLPPVATPSWSDV